MNDDSKKDTPAVNTETPAPDQPNQGTQETHQPADEEIGDYADPDSVQVDGGDNSSRMRIERRVPPKNPTLASDAS
jgi:hypothetical protein